VTDREACIILNLLPGIGSARLQAMLDQFGRAGAILEQPEVELARVKNIPEKLAVKIADWRNQVDFESEMALAERAGVRIITLYDEEYPQILKGIYDPPVCLYVRGNLPDFSYNSIAIVGSRRVTVYGKKMAKYLSEAASYAGWTIVSGLAYGVDALAHQAALDTKGTTVAVLGGGLARIHPQEHTQLARNIVESGGAVISEYPMNYPVSRQSFPRRNRIVSGLSQAVLVVEAGINSGALLTANIGLEQGKTVFAVPGQADNPQAKGCHHLIKEGARLVETFDDVLADFEFLPGFSVNEPQEQYLFDPDQSDEPKPELNDSEQIIMDSLLDGQKSVDELSVKTGLETGKLLSLLMKLEFRKLISQLPGRIFSRS